MKLSAPTQPVFIISLILAVIGTLPLVGVSIPIGISAVWALALAYVVLLLGVLLKNF
ncbi:MAG: hypothetical protein R3D59_16815 [Paracoccaceae bacterium]